MPKSAGWRTLPLEQRIREDNYARQALETLFAHGAEADELWSRLHALETSQLLSFESWSARSRLSRRDARALAKRLKADAEKIHGFFSDNLYWYYTVEQKFGWIRLVQKYLKLMSGLIEGLLLTSDDRGADDARPAKRFLTEYVQQATGRPHGKEVADLIRVTLRLENYTAEDQRKFRTRPRKTGHV